MGYDLALKVKEKTFSSGLMSWLGLVFPDCASSNSIESLCNDRFIDSLIQNRLSHQQLHRPPVPLLQQAHCSL